MKKRYLFIAVAILAAGLVFSGCDLLGIFGNDSGGQTYDDLTITGAAADGTSVTTIFSTTRGPGKAVMPKPETGDTYRILYANKEVSRGGIEVRATTITFKPSSGEKSFDAILGTINTNRILNFPYGIQTSDGPIDYISDAVEPEFETNLDGSNPIAVSVGQATTLTVAIKSNSDGGAVSYQWYKADSASATDTGTAISGATSASYTVTGTVASTIFYYVMVTNASGGVKNSNKARVVVGSGINISIGGGSGVGISALTDVINAMLGNNKEMPYTVTFNDDLPKSLFISDKTFPGTGKVTIKAAVPLTKGIHITRSDVELNGLKLLITTTATDSTPKIYGANCAVLISKRYANDSDLIIITPPGNNNTIKTDPPYAITTLEEYNKFSPNNTINNVEIVDCNISFVVTNNNSAIYGIYVEPRTAGRKADTRVKIKNTTVYTAGYSGYSSNCFFGSIADLSGNTFTTTGKNGVLNVYCIFGLAYSGSSANISFTNNNNKFNAPSGGRLALVTANAWHDMEGLGTSSYLYQKKPIMHTGNVSFGNVSATYASLSADYRNMIADLLAQAPNSIDRRVTLWDVSLVASPNDSTTVDDTNSTYEDYIKEGDVIKFKQPDDTP